MVYENDTDAKLGKWQGMKASHARTRRVAVIVSIVTALGWLLFLYKMSQTSEMALRYSSEAQESLGAWVLALLAMSIGSVAMLVIAGIAKKRVKALRDQLASDLRSRIGEADAGQRAKLESQLRELGA